MATKIGEVITSPALSVELIKKGQTQTAKYSWSRMATQTLDIYNKAIARRKT